MNEKRKKSYISKTPFLSSKDEMKVHYGVTGTTTAHFREVGKILGTGRYEINGPYDFIKLATGGAVRASVVRKFENHFKIPRPKAAELLHVSESTIYRWVQKDVELPRNQSIQIFELTDLFLYGTEVFGDTSNFFKWMTLPNTALGGMEPGDLIELPGGPDKVRNLLGRIEHGVYS